MDILISLNEKEITNTEQILSMDRDSTIHMTVCRRLYDHIMIIITAMINIIFMFR